MSHEIVDESHGQRLSFSTVVDAEPGQIFAVLAHTARHAEIDGSGTVQGARGGGRVLTAVGDTFGMSMKMGLPYPIKNTVVEFEPDRRIAWRHLARHRWRYELQPVDGGTRVTETFDWGAAPLGFTYGPAGFLSAHRKGIPATLKRLQAVFATT